MAKTTTRDDAIGAVALLDEPKRRRLYDVVVAGGKAVGRDAAAAATGMSRELAAFHLDRLVAGGLLETEYRRLGARTGPGAGRPAKLYRRADRDVAISFPPRRYERAAGDFAKALDLIEAGVGANAAADVARARGEEDGIEARRRAGPRPSRSRLRAALLELLQSDGYEPEIDATTGNVCLRNCPYGVLVVGHRDLMCGTNVAWAEGVVVGLADERLVAELTPAQGFCCVRLNAS